VIGYPVGASIPEANAPLEGGLGNRIRNNTLDGVRIAGDGTVENVSVRGNIVAENGGIGIDLGTDGETANDFGDTDTGVNSLQNTPEIDQSQTAYNTSTGEVEVRYRVDCNTTDCAYDLTVDFYRVDDQASEEGETYIGTDTYPAGAASNFRSIAFTPPSDVSVSTSDYIVGVATDANGNSSEFTGTSQPLPVELAGFEGQRSGAESVTLQWRTLSETNNAGFEVQRAVGPAYGSGDVSTSDSEESWHTIARLDGAGATDQPQSYQFKDTDLPYAADRLSYRLRQIDTDGTEAFSEPITVTRRVTEAEILPVYPNPAQGQATVRFATPERQWVRIALYNLLGQRVQTVVDTNAEGSSEAQLNVSDLSSGTYFVRMQTVGFTDTQRLTVVR